MSADFPRGNVTESSPKRPLVVCGVVHHDDVCGSEGTVASALHGGEPSASLPGSFISAEGVICTH